MYQVAYHRYPRPEYDVSVNGSILCMEMELTYHCLELLQQTLNGLEGVGNTLGMISIMSHGSQWIWSLRRGRCPP